MLTGVVDIRELQLLAEFSHPNIVKFVSPASQIVYFIPID